MNNTIHPRLKRIGWNHRVLNYHDFETACERDGVVLIVKPYDELGEYKIERGQDVITIDSRLRDPVRTFVAFHEFGHSVHHVPGRHSYLNETEFEADIVGIVALLPRPLIRHYTPGELSESLGYSLAFIAERLKIWHSLRI